MMKKNRFRFIAAVHLVLIKRNKILLSRRFNTGWRDGMYGVVSGHVESGERATDAMVREAEEEAGMHINPKDLEFLHLTHRIDNGYERVDFFFKASKWRGTPKNMEPNRCDDMQWFSVDAMPDNTVPYVRDAIDDIRNKKIYSEFGWQA